MKVTNESAERSVKVCADFIGLSKKDLFQNYLKVVEKERKKTPNIRKSLKRKQSNKMYFQLRVFIKESQFTNYSFLIFHNNCQENF